MEGDNFHFNSSAFFQNQNNTVEDPNKYYSIKDFSFKNDIEKAGIQHLQLEWEKFKEDGWLFEFYFDKIRSNLVTSYLNIIQYLEKNKYESIENVNLKKITNLKFQVFKTRKQNSIKVALKVQVIPLSLSNLKEVII